MEELKKETQLSEEMESRKNSINAEVSSDVQPTSSIPIPPPPPAPPISQSAANTGKTKLADTKKQSDLLNAIQGHG